MKKYLTILILAFSVFSCEKESDKDPCEGVSCYNGGTCVDGACDCPPDFTGPNCETDISDPCDDVTCENGYCANGACVCDEGYTGADCSQQVKPASISITRVDVLQFPATNSNGGGWDNGDGADIYIEITTSAGTELYSYPVASRVENADPNSTHVFDVDPDLKITSVSDRYQVHLYDYDSWDADDHVGGVEGNIYGNQNGFPASDIWEAGGKRFKVYYSYTW